MAKPFPPHPYLHGHHAPNRFEADAPDLVIEGEIPDDLAGVFYRNGPEPLHPTRGDDYHWFDGDGLVYAFFIEDGRVSMCNRWVRTEKFALEKAAGRRLFSVFGNPLTGSEDIHHFGKGAAAGELVFAPRIGAKTGPEGEADGYAMTLVHRADSPNSELAIFNAMNISAEPIARVLIPFRVPSGFHCNFYPADGALYAQAMAN